MIYDHKDQNSFQSIGWIELKCLPSLWFNIDWVLKGLSLFDVSICYLYLTCRAVIVTADPCQWYFVTVVSVTASADSVMCTSVHLPFGCDVMTTSHKIWWSVYDDIKY